MSSRLELVLKEGSGPDFNASTANTSAYFLTESPAARCNSMDLARFQYRYHLANPESADDAPTMNRLYKILHENTKLPFRNGFLNFRPPGV